MSNEQPPLEKLEMRGDFIRRHIGPNARQIEAMLAFLELSSLDELTEKVIPETVLTKQAFALRSNFSEQAVAAYMRKMRSRNQVFVSMIGMGYYNTIMPAVIKRNVLENPGWYTAYTPYQAEVSQGRLEALANFQQMIMDLTAMDLANASLLDEATAVAEAMAMSKRISTKDSSVFFVDQDCHPQTIAVVKTRAKNLGYHLRIGDPLTELEDISVFGAVVQYPGSSGAIVDLQHIADKLHLQDAFLTVAADLLSLVLLKPPGELGADIVVGSAQRFGEPMGYGGPHAAFFATHDKFKRAVPGRIIGLSMDKRGMPAYRMALQTREQHIRRDKATSNICTSQALLAIIAGFYAIYHGRKGLKLIAGRVHRFTQIVALGLKKLGYTVINQVYFDTLTIDVPGQARRIAARARSMKINLRIVDADTLGISLDETTTRKQVKTLFSVLLPYGHESFDLDTLDKEVDECIPEQWRRTSSFLTHPVFEQFHCETEMMRYMRWLARKDIALDRSMIPLGSCTMKLNAATELQALSSYEFSDMHPFVPLEQAQGYQQLFEELEEMLCVLTGFDAFSMQPNAGSQGEYAGLLVIKKYLESKNQEHRNICLIPASAHGTNPASATLAGLQVIVVACDDQGNVSVEDLNKKLYEYGDNLAALMITYPSTHGVFEESFCDICARIHDHGGQVYLDGANFNALVGLGHPGHIGADVAHINLHKTFSIPHGGGGPGMGPIGVGAHLAPFLPDHPVVEGVNPAAGSNETIGSVSAAPWGSASILTISWAYIAMMRASGLKRATQVAILNANYIAKRLQNHYPVLYTGKNGMVAHECIIDLRPIKKSCGITVDDVSKRLIDYGFHAPTVSFPVHDTMMIEPTESENKREIDRFCDAMIAIRKEISGIENGILDPENNFLRNAPHTHDLLLNDEWLFPYSRQQAFHPLENEFKEDKYWPPIARIDNVYGDRNLVCSCAPMSAYQENH